jgi:hypothetical protein
MYISLFYNNVIFLEASFFENSNPLVENYNCKQTTFDKNTYMWELVLRFG